MTNDHTEDDTEDGTEQPIWCDIDLETIPPYPVWKPESLERALTVNWERVNTLVREHLDDLPTTPSGIRLVRTPHWATLELANQEGLAFLYAEPPYATTLQISRGGHRIEAMRRRGVRRALGQCYPSDIGEGVPELHAYLPA